ncbi:SCO family protein [Pontibacter cellulosilyticus]|uniref:SCO family protein n=1 Tax=Pontibacter cellulosilyticus TaxID=1720253 RepID=A0A923SI27_9BACT|nr:SCO family protein [Pontibacter cellulosilyticus]MBC5992364.1 SCO family protein [Pontibacter cellulosilyticus]
MIRINKASLRQYTLPLATALSIVFFTACDSSTNEGTLPIYGEREPVERTVDGKTVVDTVYHTIPDFAFVNQDSQRVTQETVAGKVYITDFFFTSCPTICPKMKSQMLRVYEAYKDNPNVVLLSHSIDPTHDTVAVLKDYADRLGIETNKWHLLTGDKDSIYAIAEEYLAAAQEDAGAAGGFSHSGDFYLIDQQRRIRGHYNGTSEKDVDRLIKDIPVLLNEKNGQK